MQFEFTEEQRMIADMVGEFTAAEGTSERVRNAMATERGYLMETWQTMIQDLALPGLLIPEAAGGQELSMVEVALVFEQLGRSLLPSPLLSTAVFSAGVLRLLDGNETLKQIASGEITATSSVLAGGKGDFVLDASTSDVLILLDQDGGSLYLAEQGDPNVLIEPVATLDQTRRFAHVFVSDFSELQLLARGDVAAHAVAAGFDCARIALAAEAVGAAQTCLERTVSYTKDRIQFGRAIGSFQAVKHQMADMMVETEAAISAVYFAACAISEGHVDASILAAMAKVQASQALSFCAGRMIQLHGGIGFTWEHDAHLFFKRARSTSNLFGSNAELDDMIATEIGLGVRL